MSNHRSSDLNYHGTDDEVQLGDYIEVSLWFGLRKVRGYVSYIPGLSQLHDELGADQWAFTTEDGTTYPKFYDPILGRLESTFDCSLVRRIQGLRQTLN